MPENGDACAGIGAMRMKLKRVLSVGHINDGFRGAKLTQHMTSLQRLSLLEELRRDAVRIQNHVYPKRLRRVLEVVEQQQG